jgi:CDP-glycerol glycerophosphotransferase
MTHPPLISVVVPVYGVRQYLGECLDSVLGRASAALPDVGRPGAGQLDGGSAGLAQPATGIEVIAVDDASPDGCGALLDDRASVDKRLAVIHLATNGGPGNARNVGLARATGSYIWFIDGDDLVPAGALAAIEARLAADRPDVLLIGYQDLHPDGSTAPGGGADLLRSAPSGTFRLADAPELINLTMTSWSKVLRREFLIGLDEPFRPGIHEDVPVTCAALLAGRLGTLARVCYSYRRSRPGSFMATRGSGHLAIFDAYEDVFGLLGKRLAAGDQGATEAVQAAVFERAIWHYTSVLQAGIGIGPLRRGGLVPRRGRRAFFSRMHADFVRYAPASYRHPPGARGAKLRLVERDAYVTYEMLEPLNQLRVAVRRAVGRTMGRRARQVPE